MVKKGKSFDSLMKHIRDSHNIEISGSDDKKKLINIGYYHGYKGYKFYRMLNILFLAFMILIKLLRSPILISK